MMQERGELLSFENRGHYLPSALADTESVEGNTMDLATLALNLRHANLRLRETDVAEYLGKTKD